MIHKYRNATIRKAILKDALWVAPRLRNEDLIEIRSGRKDVPPIQALMECIKASGDRCWTILNTSDKPIAIFGVAPLAPKIGSVWLLGTSGIIDIKREFLRHSKFWVTQLHEDYDIICNCVYEGNTVHINWLKWLGFTFIRKIDSFGYLGLSFYEFLKIKKQ
jgi:hypothetical protein